MLNIKNKLAIVAGGSGKIGKPLVYELVSQDYQVVVLGRSSTNDRHFASESIKDKLFYVSSEGKTTSQLTAEINSHISSSSIDYFFNLSWSGRTRLTDGTEKEQINNITLSQYWISIASNLGCKKFISSGTIEEVIIEKLLLGWPEQMNTLTSHKWYAFSKYYSNKMQAYLCYNSKIDHIHAQIGAVLGSSKRPISYVDLMLAKIASDSQVELDLPHNTLPTTFSSSILIAKQLIYIANVGSNLQNFRLGSNEHGSIRSFLDKCSNFLHGHNVNWKTSANCAETSSDLSAAEVSANLPTDAPTETLKSMLQIFFARSI